MKIIFFHIIYFLIIGNIYSSDDAEEKYKKGILEKTLSRIDYQFSGTKLSVVHKLFNDKYKDIEENWIDGNWQAFKCEELEESIKYKNFSIYIVTSRGLLDNVDTAIVMKGKKGSIGNILF